MRAGAVYAGFGKSPGLGLGVDRKFLLLPSEPVGGWKMLKQTTSQMRIHESSVFQSLSGLLK